MRKLVIISALCTLVMTAYGQRTGAFRDAVASWALPDLNDQTSANSKLAIHGNVKFITLTGEAALASKATGGDGMAAQFNGGWLDAGQGINKELNLTGKNVSVLVRVKPAMVKGFMPLVNKAGDDQHIAYSISLNRIGEDVYIESMMGSDDIGGAHGLKYQLPKNAVTQWHDILLRFNGKLSQLYVDGWLRDDEVTVGEIRDWNRRPLLIGAKYKQAFGYAAATAEQVEATFEGLIDHVALWNSYLPDVQVKKLMGVNELKDGRPEYYHEKYRPQFHFSAKKNWLNDPNGLVHYAGKYHLFFQYMPPYRPGAYKDWGHAISTDLVHWEQLPTHITPHKVWSGCWSGSAVVDVNNTAGFQEGKEKAIVAFITNGGNPDAGIGPMNTQCIAYSIDGGVNFDYYDQNPVIKNVYKENRDPKVVWDAVSNKWIMSLFMDKDYDFGLYSSSDLKEWKYLSTVSIEGVRECPGFQPLPVDSDSANKKWLFFGANGDYVIGSFDGTHFSPETKVLRGDFGMNYYAAQTWNDNPDGRCVIIAWMPTQRYPGMPFEQQMNFPAELSLRTTPQGIKAFRMPVKEIAGLYDQSYQWENRDIQAGENLFEKLSGDLFDLDLEIGVDESSSFEIGARNTTITYDAATKMLSCGGDPQWNGIVPESRISPDKSEINSTNNMGRAALSPKDGKIRLRILVDRTTIEIFANDGEAVITSCFMPKDDNTRYSIKAKGGVKLINAALHSLKPAWIQRVKM